MFLIVGTDSISSDIVYDELAFVQVHFEESKHLIRWILVLEKYLILSVYKLRMPLILLHMLPIVYIIW